MNRPRKGFILEQDNSISPPGHQLLIGHHYTFFFDSVGLLCTSHKAWLQRRFMNSFGIDILVMHLNRAGTTQ